MEELFSGHEAVTPRFRVVPTDRHGRPHTESTDNGRLKNEKTPADGGRRRREVDARETRTVFVGNLPPSITRRKLKQLFSAHGKVKSVRLRSIVVEKGKLPVKIAKRKQQQVCSSTINAYVVFETEEHAREALTLNGALVSDRHVRVDLASSRGKVHVHSRSVFVGGLPYSVDEEEVRGLFAKYGDVESVRLVREPSTGTGRGFGFVTYSDQSGVMFALQHGRGLELGGQKLRVMRSKVMSKARAAEPVGDFSGVQAGKMRARKEERKKSVAGSEKSRPKDAETRVPTGQVDGKRSAKAPVAENTVRPSRTFHKKKEARRREREENGKPKGKAVSVKVMAKGKPRYKHKLNSRPKKAKPIV